ncbi:MAG: hypothetical protein HKN83_11885 [Gammaproteobacteria bacterium]|nr:hypothetical protein [Gammaproteobacteria bacterium]
MLQTIFASSHKHADDEYERIIDLAINMTVERTDPRLKLIRSYKKRLRDSVEIAVKYVIEVVETMQTPLEMSRSAFAADAQVNAFFASANELEHEISINQSVREFVARSVGKSDDYLYLGMAMSLTKKNVFVPVLKGEIIQHDVARTAINFSEHRFVDPSDSELNLRRKIKQRVFMNLVQCALAELIKIKDRKQELESQRILLRAKLRNIIHQALGLEPLTDAITDENINREKLETELAEIERTLKETAASIETLDQYLEIISNVMANPKNHIRVENTAIRLNRMNFATSPNDEDPGEEIIYTDFESSEPKKIAGRLIKYPRAELLSEKILKDKARFVLPA